MTDPTPAVPTPAEAQAQGIQAATPAQQPVASPSIPQTDTGAGSVPQAAVPAAAQPQSAPTKPDGLPDTFWDKDKGSIKGEDLKKHFDAEAARGDTPAEAKDYKTTLPEGFKAPEGAELPAGYEFNEADPFLQAFRKIAKDTGMSQKQFSAALSVEATRAGFVQSQLRARDAALGENAQTRLGDLATWMDASFDQKTSGQLKAVLYSPEVVKAFESMKKSLTSQGVGSFNASGREAPEANDGKPAEWGKMSNVDKRTWFIQQQREGARARH
ncbi:MAG TPA: hypothetical protein VK485_05955 [Sphingomicrobium sp.]|nr:hypothetical protein [Sphingomicrobium sp.]